MLNVVRRSQIQGLLAIDSPTIAHLGQLEEVWLDESGKVAYLSGIFGYLPLEQVSGISYQALSSYGRLMVDEPENIYHLDQLTVRSVMGEPLGWVKDFLFDWHTGEIVAYILAGEIAESVGESAVLSSKDVAGMTAESLIIQDGAQERLKPESEGLRDFLSEKSQQVQHLVQMMRDRIDHLLAPNDHPEVVRVKIKEVSDEMATAGHYDRHALQEATHYLHGQWENLQQNISRSSQRARLALDSAWKHLTGQA
ncbi:photosystem reaction center subunit H [Egbenema bharatensis]|uniref:photosystem reaction center subunit H n=1 Tax=Egbenema bharatensis TaxID=3463334 RepID=UPI003A8B05C1